VTVRLSEGGRAIRTVVLPAGAGAGPAGAAALDRSESLAMQAESLRRQLADVQRLADERAGAYARDRDALREQHERKQGADGAALRQAEAQLAAAQARLTQLTKDFLQQRAHFSASERELREQTAEHRAAREAAERELSAEQARAEAQLAAMRAQLEAAQQQLHRQLASRAEAHNDSVRLLQAQWAADKEALGAQAARLRAELARQREKNAALDRRRAGEAEGFMRDVTALRRAVRQLETQWAVLGGALGDAAVAQDVADMEAQARDIAARLGEVGQDIRAANAAGARAGGGGALEGVDIEPEWAQAQTQAQAQAQTQTARGSRAAGSDWLPTRAANAPTMVAGIRPGAAARRPGTAPGGRNTLAGFNAADYYAREAAEAARGAGAGANAGANAGAGAAGARRRLAAKGDKPVMYRAPVSSGYGATASPAGSPRQAPRVPAQAPTPAHSHAQSRAAFASPMDIDNSPPSALRRSQAVAVVAAQYLRAREEVEASQLRRQRLPGDDDDDDVTNDEDDEDGGAGAGEAGVSPVRRLAGTTLGLGAARRVPASAPNAAPRFDATVQSRSAGERERDTTDASDGAGGYEGSGESGDGGDDEAMASPGAVAARASANDTRRLRSQLETMRDRLHSLESRASGFADSQ